MASCVLPDLQAACTDTNLEHDSVASTYDSIYDTTGQVYLRERFTVLGQRLIVVLLRGWRKYHSKSRVHHLSFFSRGLRDAFSALSLQALLTTVTTCKPS